MKERISLWLSDRAIKRAGRKLWQVHTSLLLARSWGGPTRGARINEVLDRFYPLAIHTAALIRVGEPEEGVEIWNSLKREESNEKAQNAR